MGAKVRALQNKSRNVLELRLEDAAEFVDEEEGEGIVFYE